MMDGNLMKLLVVCLMLTVTMETHEEQNKTFILITDRKIAWYDAVYVCWRDYSSLASISNEMEYNTILNMTKDLGISFWFGLYENAISWTWSISLDTDNSLELCGSVTNISWWRVCDCTAVKPFFCYDGISNPYALVTLKKTWPDALNYCRNLYQDLSRVWFKEDYQYLGTTLLNQQLEDAWIGLYKKAWKWADGTADFFRRWAPMEPKYDNTAGCALMYRESWYDRSCSFRLNYLCQVGGESTWPTIISQVQSRVFVKIKLLSHCHLTDPDVRENLLQQYKAALQQGGLADVTVMIVNVLKQPNE